MFFLGPYTTLTALLSVMAQLIIIRCPLIVIQHYCRLICSPNCTFNEYTVLRHTQVPMTVFYSARHNLA